MTSRRSRWVLLGVAGLGALALLWGAWKALTQWHWTLLSLDARSGRVLWVRDLREDWPVSVAVDEGRIIANLRAGGTLKITALEEATGATEWELIPPAEFNTLPGASKTPAMISANLVIDDTSLIPTPLVILNLQTGEVVGSLRSALVSGNGYRLAAVVVADTLVVIRATDEAGRQSLEALRVPDGAILWEVDLSEASELFYGWDPVLATDGRSVFVNQGGSLRVFDVETGADLSTVDAQTSQFRLDQGRLFFSRGGFDSLTAVDSTDGRGLWTFVPGSTQAVLMGAQARGGRVVVLVTNGGPFLQAVVTGLDAASGEVLWEVPIEDLSHGDLYLTWYFGPLVTEGGTYAITGGEEQYTLLALSSESGGERWSFDLGVPPGPSGWAADEGQVVVGDRAPMWRILLSHINPGWY